MPRTFVWHPGRGPARTPKEELTTGMVEIRQVRSEIGHPWRMKQTLEAIGLKHHQDVVVKQDNPSLRGQIKRVRHLVQVTPVGANSQEGTSGK
jgi:large subunit ribosomal protein L30